MGYIKSGVVVSITILRCEFGYTTCFERGVKYRFAQSILRLKKGCILAKLKFDPYCDWVLTLKLSYFGILKTKLKDFDVF